MREKHVGIDVGSTTAKIAIVDPADRRLLYDRYLRHNADQTGTVQELLRAAHERYPDDSFTVAFCGSAGQTFADAVKGFFIQEVVANTLAVKQLFPESRVAIELGGQDAKVIFFEYDSNRNQLTANDMRMNGSCAGGTGAFIDQIAELLNIRTEDFNSWASRGKTLYEISGRCGVFAKTDIQPLLNQGVSKEDIALSAFHALAKQTIGGLAQGMTIRPKVIVEGGPLTFNPHLIQVFKERLSLSDEDIIVPEHPDTIVAYGAALSIESMFADKENLYDRIQADESLIRRQKASVSIPGAQGRLFFADEEEKIAFLDTHSLPVIPVLEPERGETLRAYIGIDAGSTTSKFVLLNEHEEPIYSFYSPNKGEPLQVVLQGLKDLRKLFDDRGARLEVLGVGTTGYGESLFAKGFGADYHTVETVAHARAARQYAPAVSFILDIGGQDMKAISLKDGIVSEIILNEACSAGCGSFVETYAGSLGVPVQDIARLAFDARQPSRLGSRCTVFMNSSIITEQKNGKTSPDILAGICRSIIENVFTKVVRVSNRDQLGDTVMVQGGTFKNDAVLRAMEQYIGRSVVRAPYPGEMGAIGIALLTKEHAETMHALAREMSGDWETSFIGLDMLDQFSYRQFSGVVCKLCANNCSRTIIEFADGGSYVTGNRCEKGEIVGDPGDREIREEIRKHAEKAKSVPDMMELQRKLLFRNYLPEPLLPENGITIGLPRVLDFWDSMPFWNTLFPALGFKVTLSDPSSYRLFDRALPFIPSDTVCFPAKLVHGHIESLADKMVDRIFYPQMSRNDVESDRTKAGGYYCTVVNGYAMVAERSNEPMERFHIPVDHPIFHWSDARIKKRQLSDYFESTYGIDRQVTETAVDFADRSMEKYREEIRSVGGSALEKLERSGNFGVLLAGRPYHSDPLVNHNLSKYFTRLGIPVFTLDSLPRPHNFDVSKLRIETEINFHSRLMEAAFLAVNTPNLELVQMVSFGCGHDAVLSDEIARVLKENSDKELLILKMDEGEAAGPLNIRIKSFIETIRVKRSAGLMRTVLSAVDRMKEAFPIKFLRRDRKARTIYLPNLSEAFSYCAAAILQDSGYRVAPLPLAGKEAVEIGKKYVHNDICYPAQINIGEFLCLLQDGNIDPHSSALGVAKNCKDCRAGQYAALARKALDDAGYPTIPVITTDEDKKNMHPGFKFSMLHQWNLLWGLTIIDAMERMRRRIRPYERSTGETDALFNMYVREVSHVIKGSKRKALMIFRQAVSAFNRIPLNSEPRRPRVGVTGEILMNFHPGANGNIEKYLESHGMEVVLPNMHDFFRMAPYIDREVSRMGDVPMAGLQFIVSDLIGKVFDNVYSRVTRELQRFRYEVRNTNIHTLADNIKDMIDIRYRGGEGWILPAEILEMSKDGVNSFVILQPFGCLPNHITGRGFSKPLKKLLPRIQILSLDYDPDTSFANIENRLQMLIINARELEKPAADEISSGTNSASPQMQGHRQFN